MIFDLYSNKNNKLNGVREFLIVENKVDLSNYVDPSHFEIEDECRLIDSGLIFHEFGQNIKEIIDLQGYAHITFENSQGKVVVSIF
jgi:hypothetical protein